MSDKINKFFYGYNKFRKFATGNSLEDLVKPNNFSLIETIKKKWIFYLLGFILFIFINWKLTFALIGIILFSIFFNSFIKKAKEVAKEVENEKGQN